MKADNPTFEEVEEHLKIFLKARNWGKHEPRSFAVSISLEANELLEHYQWSEDPVGNEQELADELADILLYAVQFANCYNISIPNAMLSKLKKMESKYPASDFTSSDPNELREAWRKAKKRHIKKESL